MTAAVMLLLLGQVETIDSKEFGKELQVAAITATARLVNAGQNELGSGVVLRQKGAFVYVLTANHLVEKTERLEVGLFSAKSYPKPEHVATSVEVLARSKDADLALLRLTVRNPVSARLPICPAKLVPTEKEFPVLTVGCDDGLAPTCRLDAVRDKKRIRKPGENGAALVWEAAAEPAKGRSGGPLIDRRGQVIGLCSGRSDGKGYYCHLDEICRFFKQNGFSWLLEEEKP